MLVFLINAQDESQFEICMLRTMTLVDINKYRLTLRRNRYGTRWQAFVKGDRAFIIPRGDLVPCTHDAIAIFSQRGDTAQFRLQSSNTTGAEMPVEQLPDVLLKF